MHTNWVYTPTVLPLAYVEFSTKLFLFKYSTYYCCYTYTIVPSDSYLKENAFYNIMMQCVTMECSLSLLYVRYYIIYSDNCQWKTQNGPRGCWVIRLLLFINITNPKIRKEILMEERKKFFCVDAFWDLL